jgi:hypothetical protein
VAITIVGGTMKSSAASTMVQVALPLASALATACLLRRKLGLRPLIDADSE